MADNTYNNQKVYHKREGDEFVVADGGKINMEDGSTFTFFNETYTDVQMNAALASNKVYVFGNQSTTGSVLSDAIAGDSAHPIIPSGYGVIMIDVSGAQASTLSLRLCSANFVGQRMKIIVLGGGGSYTSTLVDLSIHCGGAAEGLGSGASVIDLMSACSDISIIEMFTSANSTGFIELLGIQGTGGNLWGIVAKGDTNTESLV
jgi:hypothetical protein